MVDLSKYRNEDGKIDLNRAFIDKVILISEQPFKIGARPKKWCKCQGNQPDILFKETLIDNYEDIAEIVGYEIAKKLNLNCAEYDFAVCNGKFGVITPDFIGNNEELINGGEILEFVSSVYILPIINSVMEYKNISNDQTDTDMLIKKLINIYSNCPIKSKKIDKYIFDDKNQIDKNILKEELDDFFKDVEIMYNYDFQKWNKKKTDYVSNNLTDIWSLLDNYCNLKGYKYKEDTNIMNELIKMFFYDILVNQGDRHIKGNWGIVLNKETHEIRLAPIYDNSKICGLHNAKRIIKQRAQQIISFEKINREQNPRKYEAAANQINSLSEKTQSKLMIDYDDNINNTDKFDMLEKLINISDNDTFTLIQNLFNNLMHGEIVDIIDDVEKKYKMKIPLDAKVVLIKTININIERVEQIILKKERELGEQNGKQY